MKNKILISLGIISLSIISYLIYLNSFTRFELRDSFVETGKNAKIYFSFVEVDQYDSLDIVNYSRKILDSIDEIESGRTFIKITHYYNKEEFEKPNDTVLLELSKRYPNSLDLHKKLDYVSNGFIFTGSNRKLKKLNNKHSALFKSDFFVPKPEFKASEILKRGK